MSDRATILSPCREYRYTLWREWEKGQGYVMFVGLNPSTADETQDDPTIRRCVDYAKRWGYRALCMTNLFAYRCTSPEMMMRIVEPIGDDNDLWLREIAECASIIVAAWGVDGGHRGRDVEVLKMLREFAPVHCLQTTKMGFPNHPLYLKKELTPILLQEKP